MPICLLRKLFECDLESWISYGIFILSQWKLSFIEFNSTTILWDNQIEGKICTYASSIRSFDYNHVCCVSILIIIGLNGKHSRIWIELDKLTHSCCINHILSINIVVFDLTVTPWDCKWIDGNSLLTPVNGVVNTRLVYQWRIDILLAAVRKDCQAHYIFNWIRSVCGHYFQYQRRISVFIRVVACVYRDICWPIVRQPDVAISHISCKETVVVIVPYFIR